MVDTSVIPVTSWLQIVLPLAIIGLQAWKMWLDKDVPRTVQEVRTQTNGVRVAAESAAKDAKDAAYLAGLAAGQKGEQERVAAMLGKADSAAQRLEQLKVDKR